MVLRIIFESLPVLILCIVALGAMGYFFARAMVRPLERLTENMNQIQLGFRKVTVSSDYQDEVGVLIRSFRRMMDEMNRLITEVYEGKIRLQNTEMKALQAQINPHFLYNILGSIKTCISLDRLKTADEMITDLTRFYRLTLRKSGDLIAIRDELEIARLYLEMEKLCHGDSLSWEIRAEDGIQNFLICRFTLQPFLENSIQHGISRQTPCVHISLDVSYGDDTVIITITDNGAGIAPRQLEDLRAHWKTGRLTIRNISALET